MKKYLYFLGFFLISTFANKSFASKTNASVCQGSTYTWKGQAYTQNGTFTNSGDTLVLVVNPLPFISLSYSGNACLGSTLTFIYSDSSSLLSGWYNDTITSYYGIPFDSIPASTVSSPYSFSNPNPGKYKITAVSQAGCSYSDSIITGKCASSSLFDTICQGDSVFFNNQWRYTSGSYQQQFQNGNGVVDSLSTLYLTVNSLPSVTVFCYNTSTGDTINVCFDNNSQNLVFYAQTNITATVAWKLGGVSVSNSQYFAPATSGTYTVYATSACGTDTATYTLEPCLLDLIWPGDANHDGVVDNNDLLPIGIANGLSGLARNSTSIAWQGYACADWGLQLLNGTNIKHADCDGNGQINNNDTLAIAQNFSLTHNKKDDERKPSRAGIPDLQIVFFKNEFVAGDTLIASIQLGNAQQPIASIYGLAFTYNFDPNVLDASTINFNYSNSWLGASTDKISLVKIFNSIGKIKTAITRTDHVNRSGQGEIAQFRAVVTTNNISADKMITHFISNLKAIDKSENVVDVNEGTSSVKIISNVTSIRQQEILWWLYPSPAQNYVTISGSENIKDIVILNVLGEKVYTETNLKTQLKTVDILNLPTGIYIAQIATEKGRGEKRFMIMR